MATNAYIQFRPYNPGQALQGRDPRELPAEVLSEFKKVANPGSTQGISELLDYHVDVEQTLNIGSQSTGAGAGKVIFNPLSITRTVDADSPLLFERLSSGTPFQQVTLLVFRGGARLQLLQRYDFKLVAVRTINWGMPTPDQLNQYNSEHIETITFEYGGLGVHYVPQLATGAAGTPVYGGWNRVRNVRMAEADVIQ